MPRTLRSGEGLVGTILLVLIVAIAVLGPLVAPYPLDAPVGIPGAPPSAAFPLGTDFIGRDVLSRVLYGGASVLAVVSITIVLTYLIGVAVGMASGLLHPLFGAVTMRTIDIIMSIPSLLLILVLISGMGSETWVLVLGMVLVLFPGVARIVRTATMEIATRSYIEAAWTRGENWIWVAAREVFPNISHVVFADLGVRFSSAVILSASVNFLGLGAQPPAANWGLLVAENRDYIGTNVWAVLVPSILLALLVISVNLLSEAYVRSLGRSRL
ncbi:ABC transporter permease [Microbacterium atlanticum]|uniref:ABC transporter permease n=1 Tax=Microbacterium atlanticum TaxID=2782168 RepID=UPI001887796B|nr:ABC transporter permease [Microbacterium atlanticum]